MSPLQIKTTLITCVVIGNDLEAMLKAWAAQCVKSCSYNPGGMAVVRAYIHSNYPGLTGKDICEALIDWYKTVYLQGS